MKTGTSLGVFLLLILGFSAAEGATKEDLLRSKIVQQAYNFLDTPYRYGGTERTGMDCSGLVYRVFRDAAGKSLPRQVGSLYTSGEKVGGSLLPGDLVFFNTTGEVPSHVGIYIGRERFIHAASEGPNTGVIISSLTEKYYKERALDSRRIIRRLAAVLTMEVCLTVQESRLESPVRPHYPLTVAISSAIPKSLFLTVHFRREGKDIFARRIRLEPEAVHCPLWFKPSEGAWQIRIEDKTRTIRSTLNFIVGRDY
ncbi:hypothetical protein ES703_30068 [subsurface metagenome]